MNRIEATFKELARQAQKAFIPYITAGDPTLELSGEVALELEQAGADIIELGVPFSDPIADGIVNQEAAQRALKNGTSLRGVIRLVRQLRGKTQVPIMLFTYFNPVLAYGLGRFAAEAKEAGVDGVLCIDLPPEEAGEYKARLDAEHIATVFLAAPTSTPERIALIAEYSTGFIYYVSRTGVTGIREALEESVPDMVAAVKGRSNKPVAVGFGISKPEHAQEIAGYADGVVVGSALVRLIGELGATPDMPGRVAAFAKSLAEATKHGG